MRTEFVRLPHLRQIAQACSPRSRTSPSCRRSLGPFDLLDSLIPRPKFVCRKTPGTADLKDWIDSLVLIAGATGCEIRQEGAGTRPGVPGLHDGG